MGIVKVRAMTWRERRLHQNYAMPSASIEWCSKHAAAPELLEACRVALPHVEAAVRNSIVSRDSADLVRAAIAKAEGR
jgi:hypothetical protein